MLRLGSIALGALVLLAGTGCSPDTRGPLEFSEGVAIPLFIEQLVELRNDEATIGYRPPLCAGVEIFVHQQRFGDDVVLQAFAVVKDSGCEDLTVLGERTSELIELEFDEDGPGVVYDGWCLAVDAPCETPLGDVLSGLALSRERPD